MSSGTFPFATSNPRPFSSNISHFFLFRRTLTSSLLPLASLSPHHTFIALSSPPPASLLQRLSTTSVPFTVLSMTHNPCNEDLLVVCGLTECQLLVINSSGQVVGRSLLHPSVGNTGYIVKAVWVSGSPHQLVLVSDSFVKVFDTHTDVISPTYYFVLDEGKIRDATVAVTDEVRYLYPVILNFISCQLNFLK